jgi:hypothetical protein
MIEKIVDTIVFGTGYVSFGYASTHENTLIIERAELADKHFCGALKVGSDWNTEPKTKYCAELKQLYEAYGLLDGEKADVASMESVFCEFLKKQQLNVLLLTETVSVEKENGLFVVTVYNNEGISKITAKKLIDTSSTETIIAKGLNLLTFHEAADFDIPVKKAFGDDAFVAEGKRETEKMVYVPVGLKESVLSLKLRITENWRTHVSKTGARISMIAPEFAYTDSTLSVKKEDNWHKIAECNFKNGFEAFDFGAQFDFGGEQK